jgi:hypothetical protein
MRKAHLEVPVVWAGWIIAVSALAVFGFFSIFNTYLWYDDEGYILISLKGVLEGHALYTEVYTQYGPVFYQFFAALYSWFPIELNHSNNRIVTLISWLIISFVAADLTFRIHRSKTVALICFTTVVLYLQVCVKEPGHPQMFCMLLTVLALWLLARSRTWGSTFLIGALIAGVTLTKPNLGAFLLMAAFGSVACLGRGNLRWLSAAALLALFLAFSTMVLKGGVSLGIFSMLATAVFALLAIRVTAATSVDIQLYRAIAFVSGGITTAIISVACAVASGSSIDDLLWATLAQHSTLTAGQDAPFSWIGAVLALLGFLAALDLRSRSDAIRWTIVAVAKLVFGLGTLGLVIAGFYEEARQTLSNGAAVTGNAQLIIWLAPGFVWLYCLTREPTIPVERICISMASVFLILGAYPIPGSQLAFSSVLLVVVALGCLQDALADLRTDPELNSLGPLAPGVMLIMLLSLGIGIHRTVGFQIEHYWAQSIGTEFPGAKWLRLSTSQGQKLTKLVRQIQAECSGFVAIPSMSSLYFWANMRPLTWWNQTVWPYYLTPSMQNDIVLALEAETSPCVVAYNGYPYLRSNHANSEGAFFAQYVLSSYEESWTNNNYSIYRKTK